MIESKITINLKLPRIDSSIIRDSFRSDKQNLQVTDPDAE